MTTRNPGISLWCIVWGAPVKLRVGKDTKYISKPLGIYEGKITEIEEIDNTVFYTLSYPDLPEDTKISISSHFFSDGNVKIFGNYIYDSKEKATKEFIKIRDSWRKKISGYLSANRNASDNFSKLILELEESSIILSDLLEE